MGLGRFLYTPVLPMMVEGAGLGPSRAGLIASANFAGYLAGALAASLPGMSPRAWTWLVAGLAASAATTAAMALTDGFWPWVLLRFAGGWASAFILIFTSALVVSRLRQAGGVLPMLHFAGVGVGIAISALISAPLIAASDAWPQVWLTGGALSALALVAVLVLIPRRTPQAAAPAREAPARTDGLWRLVLAYGCFGFGYVITATFIVAMLREGPGGRGAETVVWLIVGLTAAPSVVLWARVGARIGAIRAYQAAMLIEAAGVGLSALSTGTIALALAAAALGGTFVGLTAVGLQEAARRAGGDGRAMMALMTASFGLGQMIGPAMAGWMRDLTGSFAAPSLIAAAVLVAGGLLVWPMRERG
ncbi:MAG: YbfB/YjiJ family MFS transporter [Proteobacteria bacterium]|nr:YbfB/YjiJ family MFS transporter [Pseudomonadota bacterium]